MSRATRYAAGLAGVYVILAVVYIAVSGSIAFGAAGADAATLRRIELTKGISFVLLTGALGFFAARALLLRLADHRSALATAHIALVRTEHQARATLLATTCAHDLNNMLSVLFVGVEELAHAGGAENDEVVQDMRDALDRVARLAKRLSNAGKGILSGPPESVDLGALVADVVQTAKRHPVARKCQVEHEVESIRAEVRAPVIEHLVTNLVLNAAESGAKRIRVTLQPDSDGGPRLEVHDDGSGVAPAERERIFAPFYTTKADGTGLGLLSVRLGAALHDGEVTCHESPLGGACFRVTLGDAVDELDEAQLDAWVARADVGRSLSEQSRAEVTSSA